MILYSVLLACYLQSTQYVIPNSSSSASSPLKSYLCTRKVALISCSKKKKICHVSVAMAVVWVPTNHFSHTNFKMVTKFETLWFPPRKHRTSAVGPIMSAGTHLPLWAWGWPPWLVPSTGCRADPVSAQSCHGNLHSCVCCFAWRNLHFLAMAKQELDASGSAKWESSSALQPRSWSWTKPMSCGSKEVGRRRKSNLPLTLFHSGAALFLISKHIQAGLIKKWGT